MDLPNEMYLEISKYLTLKEIYNTKLVNKKFGQDFYYNRTDKECMQIKMYTNDIKCYIKEADYYIYINNHSRGSHTQEYEMNEKYIHEMKIKIRHMSIKIILIAKNLRIPLGGGLLYDNLMTIQNYENNNTMFNQLDKLKMTPRYYRIKIKNGLYYLNGIYTSKREYQIEKERNVSNIR